jgi:glutamyl-tRNA(Gln) amidotransferase subunit E
MPLIETVTEPAMKTPNEVAEVAWICTNLVRSTNRVRRGMGAAREDVNVSVEGGTRIEIKGVAKISSIPLLTYNEARRQWNLLRLREELKSRKITSETFSAESKDITQILKGVNYAPLKSVKNNNLSIQCVVLNGFAGLLNWETQTDTYFANEISDRVRVIACLTNIPNIIHSDSEEETIANQEWKRIKRYVKSSKADTLVLVWGSESDTETAVKEIIIRAKEATEGIPSETRQAFNDGTNGFERILPGADRMYPDTDLPPKKLEDSKIDNIRKWLPEKYWERQKWYVELGIPEDTIKDLSISPFAKLFKKAVNEWELNPTTIAVALIQFPKRIKKEGLDQSVITESMFYDLFYEFKEGNIPKDSIYLLLKKSVLAGSFSKILLPNKIAKNDLDRLIKEKLYSNNTAFSTAEKKHKYILGNLMNKLRGMVPVVEVAKIIEIKYEGAENV